MKTSRNIALLGLSTILFYSQVVAQQRTPRPPASEFNIELINLDNHSHMFSVPGLGLRAGYIARSSLRRIPAWKPSEEESAEVSAFQVQFWLEEGSVRVEVTAYLGPSEPHSRPSDWVKLKRATVVSHLVRQDEVITISETERFGIEPFMVKVVRAEPWSIGPPELTNKTQALTITGVAEERPVYIVTVRNVSHKHIDAIRWYGLENGRKGGGSGLSGARLIAAGDVFEIRQHFEPGANGEAEGSKREQPLRREIVIAVILFDDGTFEGEADAAAEIAAHRAGQRIQLLRAIQLLRNTSAAPGEDESIALAKLKRNLAALGEEFDPEVVSGLSLRFASASEDTRKRRIREEMSNGLRFVKKDLSHQIENFEYRLKHTPDQADFEGWVKQLTTHLEREAGFH